MHSSRYLVTGDGESLRGIAFTAVADYCYEFSYICKSKLHPLSTNTLSHLSSFKEIVGTHHDEHHQLIGISPTSAPDSTLVHIHRLVPKDSLFLCAMAVYLTGFGTPVNMDGWKALSEVLVAEGFDPILKPHLSQLAKIV